MEEEARLRVEEKKRTEEMARRLAEVEAKLALATGMSLTNVFRDQLVNFFNI